MSELTERQKVEILDLVKKDEAVERLVHRVHTLESIVEGLERRLRRLEREAGKHC